MRPAPDVMLFEPAESVSAVTGRKIFVCYRREDTAGHAGRLYDRLNLRFPGRVFMDVAGIGLGTRWAEVIEQTLTSCEVVLLLIGRRWLEPIDPQNPVGDGRRRIDAPDDPLRAEIATALRLGRTIIPVLVGGASMPVREGLPLDVAPLADWQAMRVDDDDFDHGATRLIRALEVQLADEGADPHLEQAAARRAEIDALFAEAGRAAATAAWITAAQTLRAILSLDPDNQRAALDLREVERQAMRTYSAPPPQAPPRTSRRSALGAIGALAIGVALGALVLVVVLLVAFGSDPAPDEGVTSPSRQLPPDEDVRERADDTVLDRPETNPPAVDATAALVGNYLLAAYIEQGTRLPVRGRLSLTAAGTGGLHFETEAADDSGEVYWFRGVLQRGSGGWTTTTTESSDPAAVRTAIPTTVEFDGATLTMTNAYGEAFVWHRQ